MRRHKLVCHHRRNSTFKQMALLSRISALSSKPRVIFTPLSQRFWPGYGRSSVHVADRPQVQEGCMPYISNPNLFRAFSTGQDLSIKKCVPCNSKDLRAMTDETANILIQRVPGWNLTNESGVWKLQQSWKVKTFVKGMEFLRLVADVAESEGHHPDLHLVGWNNVKIDIWTHAVGGLTENDFILAAKINGLNLHHLLRITPN